jgi:3'(2'), 5'-bisphosphate nucleotidase
MTFEREKQTAIAAVTRAALLCQSVRSEIVVDAMQKDDKSPVTIADFGSQALVCLTVREAFPSDPIVGEEDATELRKPENAAMLDQVMRFVQPLQSGATPEAVCNWIDAGNGKLAQRFWTLDPIDGTKGFLRNDQYAIALALIVDGQVQVSALACPALPLDANDPNGSTGVIFVAARGQGASMAALNSASFAPIRVAQPSDADRLRFVESVEAAHGHSMLQEAVARAAGVTRPALRMDSQAKYGAVARGDAALYLRLPSPKTPHYREKIWDHAAGVLIVQ